MKSIIAISVLLLTFASSGFNDPTKATRYIEQYKHLAISEMHRTGVPASIKLAQGLLESGWGESTLAVEANNHFGMKCGSSWTGGTHYVYDDDYKNGKKIKSCFRVFASAHESYIAHSEFLSNPKKERYALLFYFPPTDYKAWAYGLKDAGYATDPKYPNKLISIIEKYELHQYDGDGEIIAYEADASRRTSTRSKSSSQSKLGKLFNKRDSNRSRKRTDVEYHIVSEGEQMRDLARQYGIPSALLYSKNRMPLGTEPLVGEKIQLKGTVRIGERPKFDYPNRGGRTSEFVFSGND